MDKLSIRTQGPKTLDSDPQGDGLGSDLPPDLVPIDYCMEGYGIDGGGGAGGGFVKVCLRVYLSYNGEFSLSSVFYFLFYFAVYFTG